MAFKSQDLSVLAYANGFTLWHYKTEDFHVSVDNVGYFNDAHEMIQEGDLIIAKMRYSTTSYTMGLHFVRSNVNGVVDLANPVSFGHANSD